MSDNPHRDLLLGAGVIPSRTLRVATPRPPRRTLQEAQDTPDAIVLVESGPAGRLKTGKLNRTDNIIEGATLIGPQSSNGVNQKRKYTEVALRKIASMAEGLPGYLNHVATSEAFKARDVKNLAIRHRNVRFDPRSQTVKSDMHVVAHHAPLVFALAEQFGDYIGNSLVSKGVVTMEGDTEVVQDVVQLRSADLVSDPASTRGLFEGKADAEDPVTIQDLIEALGSCTDPHARLLHAAIHRPFSAVVLTKRQALAAYARMRGVAASDLPSDAHARFIAACTR